MILVSWKGGQFFGQRRGTAADLVFSPASLNNNSSTLTDVKLADNALVGADSAQVFPEHTVGFPSGVDNRFKEFLTHPVLIQHVDWTAATVDAIDNDLLTLFTVGAPAQLLTKFRNMFYFRATIRIKVVVQGAPQAMGQIVYAFTPYQLVPSTNAEASILARVQTRNYTNSKIVPHLIIDPSQTKTYELDLPVCTPNGLYCFSANYSYGSYSMVRIVFNPLDTGTAAIPPVKICVYMSLVDPVFDGLTSVQMTGNEFVEEKTRPLSSIASGVTNVSNAIGANFPLLSPFTTLFSTVSGGAASVLSALGYSRPPELDLTTVNLTRTCDAYSQTDGRSSTIVLGPSQTTGQSIAPGYGEGDLSDMDIASLVKLPGLILLNQSILPAATSGALLKTIFVSPLMCFSPAVNDFEPNPMAGIAICHTAWRGDILYTFEFIASVFHRCTVLIAYDPFPNAAAPTLAVALSTLANVTINISGNTAATIRVPYKQPKPALRLVGGYFADGTNPPFDNGTLYMFLINPVVSNGSTAPIDYNVYMHSDNIKFMAPVPHALNDYQVRMTGNDFVVDPVVYEMGRTTDMEHVGYLCFPDVSTSVKDLTRRHCLYGSAGNATGAAEENFFIMNIPVPRTTLASDTITTFHSWISTAYLGFRGSNSWTVRPRYIPGDNTTLANQTIMPRLGHHTTFQSSVRYGEANFTPGGLIEDAFAWTAPNLLVTSRADVVVPIFLAWRFLPTRNLYGNWYDNLQVYLELEKTSSRVNIDTALAAGDDVTYCWFLGFPVVAKPP